MSSPIVAAIAELQDKIRKIEEEQLLPLKQAVNQLCKITGQEPMYGLDSGPASTPKTLSWRLDEFFNRPLATCVSEILIARRDSAGLDGPATAEEIHTELCKGGYKWEGATGSVENQVRALKIALTKNSALFVKIGENDAFGLRAWYNMRAPRKRSGDQSDDAGSDSVNGEGEANSEAPQEGGKNDVKDENLTD